jgi:hypothetical protein
LAGDKAKDVTVLRLAFFPATHNSDTNEFQENYRYLILTREKGGAFEVVIEAEPDEELLERFWEGFGN